MQLNRNTSEIEINTTNQEWLFFLLNAPQTFPKREKRAFYTKKEDEKVAMRHHFSITSRLHKGERERERE